MTFDTTNLAFMVNSSIMKSISVRSEGSVKHNMQGGMHF